MGALATGAVVVLPFPFSDLSASKRRPAVVLASAGNGDWICCMVTSNAYADSKAITLASGDLAAGTLSRVSYARPSRLFTAH
jgi:mRNA interferase MazF